jgi:hypothetical protein
MKFIVPIPVKVIVPALEKATFPVPAVASPSVSTAVVEAKARVPEAEIVHDRATAVVPVGIVTVAVAGMVTSSAAVGWTEPTHAPFVFQLLLPVFATIALTVC